MRTVEFGKSAIDGGCKKWPCPPIYYAFAISVITVIEQAQKINVNSQISGVFVLTPY